MTDFEWGCLIVAFLLVLPELVNVVRDLAEKYPIDK